MKLVFLHGPAAVGKLTVARELAAITGLRLFHNHLTVDALLAVFDFGTEPFVRLREEIWLSVFREAARHNTSLIFTFAPERTVRPSFIQETIEIVESSGGKVFFVELTSPVEEVEKRLTNASREACGKLSSVDLFRELSRSGAFDYPKLPDSGLTIDTSQMDPTESAQKIAAFFSLENASH